MNPEDAPPPPATKEKFFMWPKVQISVSQNGPPPQGIISGTTGQVGGSGAGSHRTTPVCSLVAIVLCPVSCSLAGSSKHQLRAKGANVGRTGPLLREKGSCEYFAGRFA